MVYPELFRVWLTRLPFPAEKPPRFGELAVHVHAKVEPDTLEVKFTEIEEPVQIVWLSGVVVTCGVGLTVTVKPWAGPVQPFATGVVT
jgi:hypothetical protein